MSAPREHSRYWWLMSSVFYLAGFAMLIAAVALLVVGQPLKAAIAFGTAAFALTWRCSE